jgi:Mrp family chromosome partitioning ATPase
MIGSSRTKDLIRELRESFDRVIFDAPPVLGATEAVVLASLVDGNLLVLSTGKMDRRAIRRTHEIFGNTRATILGGVLNRVNKAARRYSYEYYRAPTGSARKG